MAVFLFVSFVAFLLWLSYFLGKRSRSADSFFVADGQVSWFVNGVALTGGYLSAASFLGICGMIAFRGFDGFLYSMGFLSGWVVALFVVAEPLRKLGKYTFADALAERFESPAIHLAASVSTLVICLFYLVPQMVGAGVLIEPLLGIAHHWGVILVGLVVIIVVASAGMSSTTYVQFIKASMLISFSAVLVLAISMRGIESRPDIRTADGETLPRYIFETIPVDIDLTWEENLGDTPYNYLDEAAVINDRSGELEETWLLLEKPEPLSVDADGITYYIKRQGHRRDVFRDRDGVVSRMVSQHDESPQSVYIKGLYYAVQDGEPHVKLRNWWRVEERSGGFHVLQEAQNRTRMPDGQSLVNGLPSGSGNPLFPMGRIAQFGTRSGHDGQLGWIGPLKLLATFSDPETEVRLPRESRINYDGSVVTLYYPESVKGNELMRPGGHFDLTAGNWWSRLDFISLMLALFFGTAALPHVLIRYYTVKDTTAARKSTIVAISSIGLFYVLTLFLGLGAIANAALNPETDNMSAPLLAQSFGDILFAIITALAFATVLGTVAGLIVAASGAVANDLLDKYMGLNMSGRAKVIAAKSTAVSVGIVSVALGIMFRGVNVGFLVGWAFAVAASANFPAIMLVLFWEKTTSLGVIVSIFVGIAASVGIILAGPDMFELYGLPRGAAWIPLSQPAILAMPLSFITVIIVSLLTPDKEEIGEPIAVVDE